MNRSWGEVTHGSRGRRIRRPVPGAIRPPSVGGGVGLGRGSGSVAQRSVGGPFDGGMSRRRHAGLPGSMVKPRPWMATWWWYQHTVARFPASAVPPSDQGTMWWTWRRCRDVQPATMHPSSRASTNRLRRGGMTRARRPMSSGVPCAALAVTSTMPSQRMASSVSRPTRGPESIHTPASPFDGAASVASTNTVNTGAAASTLAPSEPRRASMLIFRSASALRVVRASPSATARVTSGRDSSRRAVATRFLAVSGATSSLAVAYSTIDRHPSAVWA